VLKIKSIRSRKCAHREELMNRRTASLLGGVLIAASPAFAAEVTSERLINADREPQNWLMNHRTYDAQRYSPLDKINKGNVKDLKISYAVAIGGTAANENLEATPLAEDGFLYVVDQWGVLYKIDGRSGKAGRIVWRMDPGQEKIIAANRGAALSGSHNAAGRHAFSWIRSPALPQLALLQRVLLKLDTLDAVPGSGVRTPSFCEREFLCPATV
jgi:glucose dehydrogenase